MASGKTQIEKYRSQVTRLALDGQITHIRLGRDWDRPSNENAGEVTFIGSARDLHGPDGVCVCCHGRRPA